MDLRNADRTAAETSALDLQIDHLCDAFEAAWKASQTPAMKEYLERVDISIRGRLLRELLYIELQCLSQHGRKFPEREYRETFPEHQDVVRAVLADSNCHATWLQNSLARRSRATSRDGKEETVTQPASPDHSLEDTAAISADIATTRPVRPKLPRDFGDYQLIEEIARGGMGVVFRARHVKLNRTVALKMILAGQFASQAHIQRFYAEARAAAKLDHSGIVPIYEIGEHDGQHFFAMALEEGGSLSHQIKNGPLPARQACEHVQVIAEAVHFAHLQGVVHRDLKPQNVLLDRNGRPKVTDFGLAKQLGTDDGLTNTGDVLGTPAYMAPEQAAGKHQELGPLVDVYALGAVLYSLLTGRPPFQAASTAEILGMVLSQEPISPRALVPSIPYDLETICLKCLQKDPVKRFKSAADLAEDLGRFLRNEPIHARPVGRVERTIRWCRRNPIATALVCSLFLLLATLAGVALVVQKADRADRLTNMERLLSERLKSFQLNQTFMSEQEQLIAEIEAIDPDRADEDRRNFLAAAAAAVRGQIDAARLTEEGRAAIAAAIQLVATRDAPLGEELKKELAGRYRDWQTVWELKPPFAEAQKRFVTAVKVGPTGLVHPAGQKSGNGSLAFLRADSSPASELRVEFASNWETARRLAVLLHVENQKGYELTLHPIVPVDEDDAGSDSKKGELTFAAARSQHGSAMVILRRHNMPLQQTEISLDQLRAGSLTLRLRREFDQLTGQVNSLPPLQAVDPFPLLGGKGQCAVRWPDDVELNQVAVLKKEVAQRASPLESADAKYDQGDFEAALQMYTREAARESSPNQDEARYKQGLCWQALNRGEDAATIFESLRFQPGDRWPAMAACQLWLLRLKQNRDDDAKEIFDTLQSRFKGDRLGLLVSSQDREAVIGRYLSDFNHPSRLLSYDPNRLARVETAEKVLRLLAPNGEIQYSKVEHDALVLLGRAYEFSGKPDRALEFYQQKLRSTSTRSPSERHYYRVLRLLGRSQQALVEIQRDLVEHPAETSPDSYVNLMLELVRTRIDLHHSPAAIDADITQALEAIDTFNCGGFTRCTKPGEFLLIRGLLCDARGDALAAQEAYAAGFAAVRADMVEMPGVYRNSVLYGTLLGSLSGKLSEAEANQFFSVFLNGSKASAMLTLVRTLIGSDPRVLINLLKSAWQTPRGKKIAWELISETTPRSEAVLAPVVLLGTQFAHDSAFGFDWRPEQEELTWKFVDSLTKAMLIKGSITVEQLFPILLAWKGIASEAATIASIQQLPSELHPGGLYVFAHRLILRAAPAEKIAAVFDAAATAAPEQAPLLEQIALDRRLLAAKQGQITFTNRIGVPARLSLRHANQPERIIDVEQPVTIDAEPGKYSVSLLGEATDVVLSRSSFTVAAPQRFCIEIAKVEKPRPEIDRVPSGNSYPAGVEIDLLSLVNLTKHVVEGVWKQLPNSTLSGAAPSPDKDPQFAKSRLVIPIVPRGSYRLTAQFTRTKAGAYKSVGFILPVGAGRAMLAFDHQDRGVAGLDQVKKMGVGGERPNLTTKKAGALEDGRNYNLNVEVELTDANAKIRVMLDGEPYLSWEGPQADLGMWPDWDIPNHRSLGVAKGDAELTIEKLRLTMLDGQAVKIGSETVSVGGSKPRAAPADQPIDLLAASDPTVDAWGSLKATMKMGELRLVPPSDLHSFYLIPVSTSGGYRMEGHLTIDAANKDAMIAIVTGPTRCGIKFRTIVEGKENTAGISQIRELSSGDKNNPTHTSPSRLKPGKKHHFIITVRPGKADVEINVEFDGELYFSWTGPQGELSLSKNWLVPHQSTFMVCLRSGAMTMHDLSLTPLDDKTQLLRPKSALPADPAK